MQSDAKRSKPRYKAMQFSVLAMQCAMHTSMQSAMYSAMQSAMHSAMQSTMQIAM
jgi:hypothetical protein